MYAMSIPFNMTIATTSDIIRLEDVIRTLLKCESKTCCFFQSAEYMHMKSLFREKNDSQRASIYLRSTPLVLYLIGTNIIIDHITASPEYTIEDAKICKKRKKRDNL